ncbi:hypothetical protein CW306_00555 [Bacillus sp. BA3]|nr:DNA/RNA helicase domain-containing protein [Bacillus sp. BA3]PKF90063.1 hypothetical protein CW306_00555 [Bacillus sp. BA3]
MIISNTLRIYCNFINTTPWIGAVLNLDEQTAAREYEELKNQGYPYARLLENKEAPKSGEWYLGGTAKLQTVAPEFVCQGLELNISVVFFGGDFKLANGKCNLIQKRSTIIRKRRCEIFIEYCCLEDVLELCYIFHKYQI